MANAGILLYLLLGSSCTFLSQPLPPETRLPPGFQRDAELLFMNGDYEEAQREFQWIYNETDLAAEDRNQALYGLACTQIIMARTDRDLVEGIANLQKWDEEKGALPLSENRRLLVLALKHQSDILVKRHRDQQRQESRKERLIANQKEKIAQLAETIERLQKQLEELEAIDEKFQEKRKSL